MVDPLNVNRRSTEIQFPFFISLFIFILFSQGRTSKARGGRGECGRTRRTPPGYGPDPLRGGGREGKDEEEGEGERAGGDGGGGGG